MGIHDLGYRTFKGRIGGRFDRIWAIFIQDFIFRVKQRNTIILLLLCYVLGVMPTVLFTYVMISLSIVAGESAPDEIFGMFFSLLFIWVIIFTTVVGSSMISNDLKYNSIILYFSRPLNKEDYFFGKFLTIFVLLLLVTLVPAMLMSITIAGLATPELLKYMDVSKVVLVLNLFAILLAVVFSSIALLLSTMTKNHLYAGVGIFAVLAFSNVIALLFAEIINSNLTHLSLWYNFYIIADDGAGFNFLSDFHWYVSLPILLVVSLVSLIMTWCIIRRVQVI